MGNLRKIRKTLNKSTCLAKTGITFGDSEVLLAVANPIEAKKKAEAYRKGCIVMALRSRCVNMHDIMGVSLVFRERMLSGKGIWN